MKTKNMLRNILLCVFLVIVLFPIFWLFISAFKHEKDIVNYPPQIFANEYTLENFTKVLHTFPFFRYLLNTVIYAFSIVFTSLLLDSMAGYAFARYRFKGRDQIFKIVLIIMMIPGQVLMIPQFLLINQLGMLDRYSGLIIPHMADAFGVFMMRSYFVSLPKYLDEAGRLDGLTEFGIFFRIIVPISIPGLMSLGTICLMANWNDLLWPLIMTNSTDMRVLSSGLASFVGERTAQYGPAVACVLMCILPLMIIYFCCQKYFISGVAMGGTKE